MVSLDYLRFLSFLQLRNSSWLVLEFHNGTASGRVMPRDEDKYCYFASFLEQPRPQDAKITRRTKESWDRPNRHLPWGSMGKAVTTSSFLWLGGKKRDVSKLCWNNSSWSSPSLPSLSDVVHQSRANTMYCEYPVTSSCAWVLSL